MPSRKNKRQAKEHQPTLRERAEQRLETIQHDNVENLSKDEIKKLVHELETHQLELEMQNEELRESHEMLERSRHKYSSLFNFAPVGYMTIDSLYNVREANYTAARLLGRELREINRKPLLNIVSKQYRGAFIEHIRRVSAFPSQRRTEVTITRKDGTEVPVALESVRDEEDGNIVIRIAMIDITDRREAEEQLAYQAHLLSRVHDAVVALDEQFRITYWSEAAHEFFGWTEREVIGKNSNDVFQPDIPDSIRKESIQKLITNGYAEGEVSYRHKAGHSILVHVRAASLRGSNGEFKGLVASMRDITERKRMEDRLKRAKALSDELNRINLLVHSTLDTRSVMMSALQGAQVALGVDGAAVGIFEEDPSKTLTIRYYYHVPESLKDQCCSPQQAKGIQYITKHRDAFAFNNISKDDRVNAAFWSGFGFSSLLAAPLMVRGEVIGAIMMFSGKPFSFDDMQIDFARKMGVSLSLAFENARLYEQRTKMEEEMRHMAHHDPLTGLPNRRLFLEILDLELKQANRNRKRLAVLFLDLDRFKEVNDTLGHDVGNALLKQVSERIRSKIRKSDTIARMGGDEFNILLSDIERPEDSADVARNIIASFKKPFRINNQELNMTTSIGISIYPDDNESIDTLLRYSDIAMYHAKEQGRDRFEFYNTSINVKSLERLRLEAMLSEASI